MAKKTNWRRLELKTTPMTQAERIVSKFGGPRRLAGLLNSIDPDFSRNPSSIYRWLYSKERGGTGGLIPTQTMPLIMKAARIEGIFLTDEDFRPQAI